MKNSKGINPRDLDKIDFSPLKRVKTVSHSIKVTELTKKRFQSLLEKGYTGESIIETACNVAEYYIQKQDEERKNGQMQKRMKLHKQF